MTICTGRQVPARTRRGTRPPTPASGREPVDYLLAHVRYMQQRDLSPETIRCRTGALRRLRTWLAGVPLEQATADHLDEYTAQRRAGALGRPGVVIRGDTFRSEYSHLRAFYVWLVRYGHRADDPSLRVVLPKKADVHVDPIPEGALADALRTADPRDLPILALSAFAGLRAAEVADLRWHDVDLTGRRLTVQRGKGGRRRTLAISDALAQILEALPHRTGPVVRRLDGNEGHATPNAVTKRAARLLGGREHGYTLHQLRHRFASAAYRGTLDIRAVQDALGHSSPAVTSIYADPGREAGIRAAAAAGQLGND